MSKDTKPIIISPELNGTFTPSNSAPRIVKNETYPALEEMRNSQQKVNRKDTNIEHIGNSNRSSEEEYMCPACMASTAVMVAGAVSTGGILAVCISKFRKFFRANRFGLFQKRKEK